ncbi:RNA-binding protein 41 [Labeo rohita]|uniref:RNA-binding protein 41 n=1 Tax=Labeo rohita TaxID=84645 RepID=A0ABQ8LK95_LABRO|nr:RNA-binding protein 41 [Labeo rohita]
MSLVLIKITRHACNDVPIPEEQETEGQRQLHNLLLQQLDTDVNIDRAVTIIARCREARLVNEAGTLISSKAPSRAFSWSGKCVAKKKCFAPAAVYKPFGEQAAGVRSLSQFQALQDGDQELAALRELGLTDAEIEVWRCRDQPESSWKDRGVCVAPEVRNERLQAIRNKMAAHAELLSRPQRFSSSRPLSRREMEIEKALFQGSDRCSFLTALYHREEESPVSQQGETSANAMDHFYKDFLEDQNKNKECLPQPKIATDIQCKSPISKTDQTPTVHDSSPTKDEHKCTEPSPVSDTVSQPQSQEKIVIPMKVTLSQSIGTLSAASAQGRDGPLTVSGRIEEISDEEIKKNRETEEGIRNIPRFKSYQRGMPSNVLCVKNMSPRASLAQMVSLFSRFQKDDTQPILYRLLTGRLKGQAFITFPELNGLQLPLSGCLASPLYELMDGRGGAPAPAPPILRWTEHPLIFVALSVNDVKSAQAALDLLNGYKLLEKPLIIEFGRERKKETDAQTDGPSVDPKTHSIKKD